jgi:hypothetical protein
MTWTWGALAGAALVAPALAGLAGFWPWGLGLWLGEALGAGSFWWIRASVRAALNPGAGAQNPWGVLGHSLARVLVVGAVFFLVLKFSALSVWAVLLGYLLVQLPGSLWQRGLFQGRKRGSNP